MSTDTTTTIPGTLFDFAERIALSRTIGELAAVTRRLQNTHGLLDEERAELGLLIENRTHQILDYLGGKV